MSLSGQTNEEKIWSFLRSHGLNTYSTAGLMGNLYAESALNPMNLQNTFERSLGYSDESYTTAVDSGEYENFVNDQAGYGLAQWTFWSRKQNLMNFAKETGTSIGDLEMQLRFLMRELEAYRLIDGLKRASSVREASNLILLQFEKPKDQSKAMQDRRAEYGQGYYDKYAGPGTTEETYCAQGNGGNSPLVDIIIPSPNHSGRRNHVIDTISIHCMAGDLSVESCGSLFAKKSTKASSNYGIGSDGRIGLYVNECNRSWCTSSGANDNRAITIEVANTSREEPYPVSAAAYKSLIDLLVDICRRNGIPELRWQADKSLIGQVDQQNMTVHRWFAAKSCPGQWLYEHHGQIAAEVNARLRQETEDATREEDEDMTLDKFKELMQEYRTELQDNDSGDWSRDAREWATGNGLIVGTGNGPDGLPNYAWADLLTREQAAMLFYRFAQMMGKQ